MFLRCTNRADPLTEESRPYPWPPDHDKRNTQECWSQVIPARRLFFPRPRILSGRRQSAEDLAHGNAPPRRRPSTGLTFAILRGSEGGKLPVRSSKEW